MQKKEERRGTRAFLNSTSMPPPEKEGRGEGPSSTPSHPQTSQRKGMGGKNISSSPQAGATPNGREKKRKRGKNNAHAPSCFVLERTQGKKGKGKKKGEIPCR